MSNKSLIILFCIIVILYFSKDIYLSEDIMQIEGMSIKETVFSTKELTNG